MLDDLQAELDALGAAHLLRPRRVVEPVDGADRAAWLRVDGRELLAFAGNDYLGLARHPALVAAACAATQRYGVGATASPSVCGHWAPHEALERELAAFVGLPAALLFHSGYAANTGVIPALVGRGDVLLSDALNHACLIDGARLSRAEVTIVPHADLAALDQALRAAAPARRRLIVTDAVFSMDGDIAPLAELLALADRHDAWLLVDDAHGFGVLGAHGQGSLGHALTQGGLTAAELQRVAGRLIYMATLGKAAGVAGAFVAGVAPLVDWLRQRARTYMFATAMPAAQAETLRTSLRLIAEEGWRRERLAELRCLLRDGLTRRPAGRAAWRLLPSQTAIQPLLVGGALEVMQLMQRLLDAGIWVPGIRPPTVPAGTARLRIGLTAAHAPQDVQRLASALAQAADAGGG